MTTNQCRPVAQGDSGALQAAFHKQAENWERAMRQSPAATAKSVKPWACAGASEEWA